MPPQEPTSCWPISETRFHSFLTVTHLDELSCLHGQHYGQHSSPSKIWTVPRCRKCGGTSLPFHGPWTRFALRSWSRLLMQRCGTAVWWYGCAKYSRQSLLTFWFHLVVAAAVAAEDHQGLSVLVQMKQACSAAVVAFWLTFGAAATTSSQAAWRLRIGSQFGWSPFCADHVTGMRGC